MSLILKHRNCSHSGDRSWFWVEQSTHSQVGCSFPTQQKAVRWAKEHAHDSQLLIPESKLTWGVTDRRSNVPDRRISSDRRDEIRFELGRRHNAGRREADSPMRPGFAR